MVSLRKLREEVEIFPPRCATTQFWGWEQWVELGWEQWDGVG